jgi:putative FmdB family regulatory protein
MPIYEFACDHCGEQAELLVKLGTEETICPACGKTMRKQISASNFHLSGHNWYKDHYGLKTSKTKKGGPKKDA